MAYIIRTIPNEERITLYYSGCSAPDWQKGFPEIWSSKEQADKVFKVLSRRWKDIEITTLDADIRERKEKDNVKPVS